jgi:hypothetical protein
MSPLLPSITAALGIVPRNNRVVNFYEHENNENMVNEKGVFQRRLTSKSKYSVKEWTVFRGTIGKHS